MPAAINAADRQFFFEVSEAAFTNPFSEHRLELDSRIVGQRLTKYARPGALRDAVNVRVSRLVSSGKAHLRFYRGEDGLVMRNVFLFEVYHCFCDALDELISDQIKAGDQPLPAKFASAALAQLAGRGFGDEEALRYFAIFF